MSKDRNMLTKLPIHCHHLRHRIHIWRWVIGAAVAIILALTAGGYYIYHTLHWTADHTYIPLSNQKKSEKTLNKTKPISILLMGTDTGAFGRTEIRGRSDTMIFTTLNPQKRNTTMVSIPRDTMAQMIGSNETNIQKINAAYGIGGTDMAVNSTSALLGVPISYYVIINMGGWKKSLTRWVV